MAFSKPKFHCYIPLLLVLFLFVTPAYTQINITGRVVDENDNAPVPGASVYFNNTTIGTYTDAQGDFYFENIHLLGTELVIYSAGYELVLYKPVAEQVVGKRIVFKLPAKQQAAENKTPLTDAVRKRWLAVFKENFLGITEEATKCSIKNENSIYLIEGENKTSLTAYADTPLVIINNMLGYKISFNLVEFWCDDSTGENYFFGYSRYEILPDNKKYIKNRQHCYFGSTLHFYRSLITHQLYEQGFGTFITQSIKNTPVAAGHHNDPLVQRAGDSTVVVPITAPEILYIDSTNNFSIRLTGRLLVQYNKEPASRDFLLTQNIFIAGMLANGVESNILFKASPTGLNNAGVLSDHTNVAYTGYWMYERLANSLPYDYSPE